MEDGFASSMFMGLGLGLGMTILVLIEEGFGALDLNPFPLLLSADGAGQLA